MSPSNPHDQVFVLQPQAIALVRAQAVELLRAEYPDRETAARKLAEGLQGFYQREHPKVFADRRADVDGAVSRIQQIYARNVFPSMKVAWGTYPDNIGHEDFPGCFRCHDDKHKSADGRVISQDCDACHAVLAAEESDPKILADLTDKTGADRDAYLRELQEKLNEALQKLSIKHRTVVTLFEIDGLSHQEIAEVMNCSVGTVRSRLHYAKQLLQAELQPYIRK